MRIAATPPIPAAEARDIRKAAEGFEALLIRQLLADARPESGQRDYAALAEAKVAEALAAQAPLGIADLLAKARK